MTAENLYGVAARQWRKWGDDERAVFNTTFATMMENAHLFQHPQAVSPPPEHWKTTCWNAAWTAADVLKQLHKKPARA